MAKKWTEMVEKQLLIIPHLFRLVTVQFFFRLSVSIYSLINSCKIDLLLDFLSFMSTNKVASKPKLYIPITLNIDLILCVQ